MLQKPIYRTSFRGETRLCSSPVEDDEALAFVPKIAELPIIADRCAVSYAGIAKDKGGFRKIL